MHTTWPEVVGVLGLVAIFAMAAIYAMKLPIESYIGSAPENQSHAICWKISTPSEFEIETTHAEQLVFYHCGDDTIPEIEQYHRWPFVYFHGKAEDLNAGNTPEASDLCVASRPLESYIGLVPQNAKMFGMIECTVYSKPARCVLHKSERSPIKGRIALLEDEKGLAHAMNPGEWQ